MSGANLTNKITFIAYPTDGHTKHVTFAFNNVMTWYPNSMIYDGKEYIIADYFDPNRFLSKGWSWSGWLTQHIWLDDGTIFEIEDSDETWSKLATLKLQTCDTNVTEIGWGFLTECKNLEKLDISGLTNITSIDSHFIAEDKI